MKIQKAQLEELYKQQYGQDIEFEQIRQVKTGSIFSRKHFVVAQKKESGMLPQTDQADAHRYSKVKYFVVPVKSRKITPGMLFDMSSADAYNMRYVNADGLNEVWRTCEVGLAVTSGDIELAKIRSSGTGDTPYIDVTDNIQVQRWIKRRFPVYDFVVSTGLTEQEEMNLTDKDIKKRRSMIYKFVSEFFSTFITKLR